MSIRRTSNIVRKGTPSAESPIATPPATPIKQERKRPKSEYDADLDVSFKNVDDLLIPKKKARRDETPELYEIPEAPPRPARALTPSPPSPAALRREEVRKKKQWRQDWNNWVDRSQWVYDPEYKQIIGDQEVHKTDAQRYFCITDREINCLPHWGFKYTSPGIVGEKDGRSYREDKLKILVSRKMAYLAGVHTKGVSAEECYKQGWILFLEALSQRKAKLAAKDPPRYLELERVTIFEGIDEWLRKED